MRAVGIVRQSRGREESLSPAQQRDRIAAHCEREGWELLAVHEEIDVSGGMPLDRRQGLRSAVEAVERGEARVVVVAYFDRLFRSLRVQGEVVARIEAAGGELLALDFGTLSERTAAQWISGTMMGVVSEYYRRSVRERAGAAQERAVAAGVAPFPNVPPGYLRGADGVLVVDPQTAPLVAAAFAMRTEGATIGEVRAFLRDGGVERSYHGVQALLCSRVVLGEIHFGHLVNLTAHEPIVERAVWEAVQRQRGVRGRRPQSDRLLARQGILRCGNCGARMVVGFRSAGAKRYYFYRCPPVGDCTQRVTIAATMIEEYLVGVVCDALDGLRGTASVDSLAADERAERSQADLERAIRAFRELGDEPAALDELRFLRQRRDADLAHATHLRGLRSSASIDVRSAWPRLTLGERRGFLRDVIGAAYVDSGRGLGRVRLELLVQ